MGVVKLIYDLIGTPVPQFLKRDESACEAIKGANGAMDVNLKDAAGVNALAVNPDGSINAKLNGSLTKGNNNIGNVNSAYDYEKLPYYVFASGKTVNTKVFAQDTNGDIYLYDWINNPTWVKRGNVPNRITRGVYTDAGILVCIDSVTKEILRSADNGLTFAVVDTCQGMLATGVDNYGETIIFGEYVATGIVTVNVRRSTDGGLTWATVLSKSSPSEIRHFHTVSYLHELDQWYITSGDDAVQCMWWKSSDNGANWTLVASGDTRLRCCGVSGGVGNALIWASDNGTQNPYIYAGDRLQPLEDLRIIGTVQGHSLGLVGARNVLMTSSRVEAGDPFGILQSEILVSGDSGKTWQTEYMVPGVHNLFIGPIFNGVIYIGTEQWESYQAIPRHIYKQAPVEYGDAEKGYSKTLWSALEVRTTGLQQSVVIPFDVYEPNLVIVNSTDVAISVGVFHGSSVLHKAGGVAISYSAPNAKATIFPMTELPLLPKGCSVYFVAVAQPTTGVVSMYLHGRIKRPIDHRIMGATLL